MASHYFVIGNYVVQISIRKNDGSAESEKWKEAAKVQSNNLSEKENVESVPIVTDTRKHRGINRSVEEIDVMEVAYSHAMRLIQEIENAPIGGGSMRRHHNRQRFRNTRMQPVACYKCGQVHRVQACPFKGELKVQDKE
ncbi:unnamed protein product [Gordionus sp. m RMFG-2023]